MTKKLKYKLKLNDSYMSEMASALNNSAMTVEPAPDTLDLTNPMTPEVIMDVVNPISQAPSTVSEEVDKEVALKLSTKLQRLIELVAEELYVCLEQARDEGDYLLSKKISADIDTTYDKLQLVNSSSVENIDCALLEILQFAKDNKINIPKALLHETLFPKDETVDRPIWEIDDAMDYEKKEGSLEINSTPSSRKRMLKAYRIFCLNEFDGLNLESKIEKMKTLLAHVEKYRGVKEFLKNLNDYEHLGISNEELDAILDDLYSKILNSLS